MCGVVVEVVWRGRGRGEEGRGLQMGPPPPKNKKQKTNKQTNTQVREVLNSGRINVSTVLVL